MSPSYAVRQSMTHKKAIEKELDGFGIRLNQKPPDIVFRKKDKGGLNYQEIVPQVRPEYSYFFARFGSSAHLTHAFRSCLGYGRDCIFHVELDDSEILGGFVRISVSCTAYFTCKRGSQGSECLLCSVGNVLRCDSIILRV